MEGTSWTGEVLAGRYRVEGRLAAGGMGEVYRGIDLERGEQVAIKVPHPFLGSDPAFARRLLREAQTVAGLRHANVVHLVASGQHEGHPYLVMELVEGESLAQALSREGALPPARALGIARGVLAALGHAHGRGVVHRDVKPGNVLLGDGETVKLVDFGIAHAVAQSAATLTATGELLGSLHYLAPERLAGQPATTAADLYGVGVLLYQMLTGRLPFSGDLPAVVAAQHLQTDPIPPSRLRPGLPPALDRVVLRALAKDPERRYPSAEAMQSDLDRLEAELDTSATARIAAPSAGAYGAALRGAGAAGGGGWLAGRLRALALAGLLFLGAGGLWYAFAVAQPDPPPDMPSVAAGPATATAATPAPTATPAPSQTPSPTVRPVETAEPTPVRTPVAPAPPAAAEPAPAPTAERADDGDDDDNPSVNKRAEQAKKQAEKRLEQLRKQQEQQEKRQERGRGRD